MKLLLLLTVLIVASCGKVEVDETASRVGESRSINPLIVNSSAVSNICQALSQKVPSSLINTQAIFSVSRKGCEETNGGVATDITTTIQNSINGFRFVQANGNIPYFGDIETLESGTMSPICTQLSTGSLISPIQNGNEYTYYSTSTINPDDCDKRPEVNEVCILVEKASGAGNGQAIVHTKEWIRFNLETNQGRVGFFTFKRQFTSASCIDGKTTENVSILK